MRGCFLCVKADDAGGLVHGKEDNADRRKTIRKDRMILIRD
ncbi:MAG: hypothetical protein PHR24_04450 [Oscillospiraceae bacterium]|nr:hypothetical protein [Oscillospiraceae bacterium]MDD3833806.1 hypothetical protein [Oscillospiraceae bacterium]MDD4546526.1 hypothetical protein [Oscillospiraceae bacterium]